MIRSNVPPLLLYKDGPRVATSPSDDLVDDADAIDDGLPPPFDDLQMDIIADLLAEFRAEIRSPEMVAPLLDQLAELRGRVEVLTAMLGGPDGVRTARSTRRTKRSDQHD